MPAGNLLWAVLLLVTWFLKVNFAVEMLVIAVLKLASRLADLKADYQKQAEEELRKSLAPQLARAQAQTASLDKTGGQVAALDGRTRGHRKEIDARRSEYMAALTRLGGARFRLPGF